MDDVPQKTEVAAWRQTMKDPQKQTKETKQ
jgi:hypothetical protein